MHTHPYTGERQTNMPQPASVIHLAARLLACPSSASRSRRLSQRQPLASVQEQGENEQKHGQTTTDERGNRQSATTQTAPGYRALIFFDLFFNIFDCLGVLPMLLTPLLKGSLA